MSLVEYLEHLTCVFPNGQLRSKLQGSLAIGWRKRRMNGSRPKDVVDASGLGFLV